MPPDTRLAYPDCLLFCARRLPGFLRNQEETTMEDTIRKNAADAAKAQENENAVKTAETGLAREFGASIHPFPTSYPGGITSESLFDERTERIIKAQADRLITTGLFEQHEREDVQNELRIVLAYEMAKYDPAKDRYTFTATVMAKRGLNAAIKRGNYLRDNPRPLSLDEPINGESGETFLDIIPDADEAGRQERASRTEKLTRRLLKSLEPLDKDICEAVMKGKSIRDIARAKGMAVSSIHHRLRSIIAARAREIGLDKVFPRGDAE